ncbi:hypothetical protein D9M69_417410 [compost metagenome]
MPECFRSERARAADELLAAGLITHEERFEMGELIIAAYSFAVEATLTHRYCGTASYQVLHADTGAVHASLHRGCLLLADVHALSDRHVSYDANRMSILRTYAKGQVFDLVETGRYANGGAYYEAIYDPITYRTLLDHLQLAIEVGNAALADPLRHRLDAAAFAPCPACHDSFAIREGCISCNAQGFVRR